MKAWTTIAGGLYSFMVGRNPTFGAMDQGFRANTTTPLYSVLGAGSATFRQIHALQPPQLLVNQVQVTNGYGGLQAGTIGGQPLAYNPNGA